MTKEFYNELLDKRLITDTKMSFEYIQENNIPLCEIITIPAVLQEILKNCEQVDMKEDTIDSLTSVIDETLTENTTVVETVEEPVVETVVETVEEPVVETVEEVNEEIVVDEPVVETVEEPVVETVEEVNEEIVVDEPEVEKKPKTKKK